MSLKSLATTLAAASLAVAPVAAQAKGAQRSADVPAEASEMGGDSTLLIVGLVAAAIVGIVLLIDDDDDPVSM